MPAILRWTPARSAAFQIGVLALSLISIREHDLSVGLSHYAATALDAACPLVDGGSLCAPVAAAAWARGEGPSRSRSSRWCSPRRKAYEVTGRRTTYFDPGGRVPWFIYRKLPRAFCRERKLSSLPALSRKQVEPKAVRKVTVKDYHRGLRKWDSRLILALKAR